MMQDIEAAVLRLMEGSQEGWRLMITRQGNVECHRCHMSGGEEGVTMSLGVAMCCGLVKLTGKLRKLYAVTYT